jgi:hypothetical protein
MRAWRSERVSSACRIGDGPQLVSALAQHFEMAVDQIEYRLQLSAEATRMFQAMGTNQITCDV